MLIGDKIVTVFILLFAIRGYLVGGRYIISDKLAIYLTILLIKYSYEYNVIFIEQTNIPTRINLLGILSILSYYFFLFLIRKYTEKITNTLIDRIIGFISGIVQSVSIISLFYMILFNIIGEKYIPVYIKNSKSILWIECVSDFIYSLLDIAFNIFNKS